MDIKALFLGKGRMNRRQFIIIFIFLTVLEYLTSEGIYRFFYLNQNGFPSDFGAILLAILYFITAFLFTSLMMRRGHDIGFKSIFAIITCSYLYFIVINYILMIPIIVLTIGIGLVGPILEIIDSWSIPFGIEMILSTIYYIGVIIMVFIKGVESSNNYGKEPKDYKNIKDIFRFWITNK